MIPPIPFSVAKWQIGADYKGVTFPMELVEEIIQYVAEDHELLKSCSLACHTWLNVCRPHLFRRVYLDHINMDEFASLSLPINSTIPIFARNLELVSCQGGDRRWLRRLVPFLTVMTHISYLRLENVDWMGLHDQSKRNLISTFTATLTHLTLSNISFATKYNFLAPDEQRVCALTISDKQPLLDDDDPSSSMMIDAPSTFASTTSTKDTPSHQSAPPMKPSTSMASTKGNGKRKRTREQGGSRTLKKQKKHQRKKGKHHANTEESDAEESNTEEEEEEGGGQNTSEDDSDSDEDVPLRLTTCTTARQLAKNVVTNRSTLICDQSLIEGPRPLEFPIVPSSAGEIVDPAPQSKNSALPDKEGESLLTQRCRRVALHWNSPLMKTNLAAKHLSSPVSPQPNDVAPSPNPTPSTSTQPLHANTAPQSLPNPAWPTWFTNADEMLKNKNLSPIFSPLLPLYVELESRTNFEVGGHTTGFRKGDRPDEVSWWIGHGRECEPTIKNVDVFDKCWWSWWKNLQPPSRKVAAIEGLLGGEHCLVEVQDDWDVLRKHGQNRFLTVLSTLAWWDSHVVGQLNQR
ncbi:uncharacterized protein LACBIDRAFT_322508 [Laccaria bicolor S238N-H82]|uniref:Predicted protein n=1 Tax=Laccaria bicolor (strain S238N-H82 / ATCC MYA-4686) TaxID=486041 RepID=B0CWJ4_LACBS|nr:uncharacterized protein LACBIDRAFT_322508 [Laccaria bicolor S238N-H82]EDR13520.1 predicted protein [Laccaria bicolor S238N-H82]|eukprot:XP_001876018.1 predicted protein [Laccaria bicolor S238N-H82]